MLELEVFQGLGVMLSNRLRRIVQVVNFKTTRQRIVEFLRTVVLVAKVKVTSTPRTKKSFEVVMRKKKNKSFSLVDYLQENKHGSQDEGSNTCFERRNALLYQGIKQRERELKGCLNKEISTQHSKKAVTIIEGLVGAKETIALPPKVWYTHIFLFEKGIISIPCETSLNSAILRVINNTQNNTHNIRISIKRRVVLERYASIQKESKEVHHHVTFSENKV